MTSIAIIGAGLAGLVLASKLKDHANITVFEKSRGTGGRMSTRYQDDYSFDHGAQYFTARSSEFKKFLAPHIASGIVQEWRPNLVTIKDGAEPQAVAETDAFYVAVPRMTSLCKGLSSGIDIQHQVEIAAVEPMEAAWRLKTTDGKYTESFDWVVSTAPSLQTCRILPQSFLHRDALAATQMSGCFTLMLGFAKRPDIAWDAAKVTGSPIGWMGFNSSKPGRPTGCSLVVQTTSTWAEEHMEAPKEDVTAQLIGAFARLTDCDASAAGYTWLHRWRYASTQLPAGAPYLMDTASRLAACGDWCIRGRIEAAFTSAEKLADALLPQTG